MRRLNSGNSEDYYKNLSLRTGSPDVMIRKGIDRGKESDSNNLSTLSTIRQLKKILQTRIKLQQVYLEDLFLNECLYKYI